MTSFSLPKHHAMNRYFREQAANMELLIEHTSEEKLASWKEKYTAKKLTPADIKLLADEHMELLERAKSFSVTLSHTKGSKALPHREKRIVAGYFMEPVRIGHGWPNGENETYIEQGLYLRSIKAEFFLKKGSVGIGAGGVALTKHMLERVYERTEVDHAEFAALIHDHMDELLNAIALTETADLWIDTPKARVTAVPFAEGLLIVNTRLLFGNIDEGDFGFRMEFPKQKFSNPYINDNFLLSAEEVENFGMMKPSLTYFGTTYFNLTTLNDAQLDYFYAFRAFLADIGEGPSAALAYITFAPNLAHEKWGTFDLLEKFEPQRDRVKGMLAEGWLKANATPPAALLLPYESD